MKRAICPFFQTECVGEKCMSYEDRWRDVDTFRTWHEVKAGDQIDVGVTYHYIQEFCPYCRAQKMYIPTQPIVEVGDCSFCNDQIIFKKYYASYGLISSGGNISHPFFNERLPICDKCIEKIKNKEIDPRER